MFFCKICSWLHMQSEQVQVLGQLQPRQDLSASQLGQEMVPGQRRHVVHRPLGDKSISSGEQLGKPKQSRVIGNLGPRFAQNQAINLPD